jgi:Na+-translocating ferredoxin:NAD+ oxidoreductase subunit B
MTDAYERLAAALDRLANGFPRTESGVELKILGKMMSPEEAALAATMTATPEPVVRIAERAGLEVHATSQMLKALARRELVWVSSTPGARGFRLAPFVVGSYEAHMRNRPDAEYAQLIEEYFTAAGWALGMGTGPALQRVVPARAAAKSEWVLPYDDVRALMLDAKSFVIEDCVCRVQQDLLDHRHCDFPVKACMWFTTAVVDREDVRTQSEALEFLDQIEKIGLVHTVSNVGEGVSYVCNCCGCCCGLLRGINEWGVADSVAQANYYAEIDPDSCTACAVCLDRCQVSAIVESDGVYTVDRPRCIGCGLCVTGCGSGAATLRPKPPAEMLVPPPNFAAWERQRLSNRGLA